mmetsp:Transcript_23573/g.40730  ORF Transcript_23573/g.40730 Transcript_23573/m.40730 type:complete len:236 (+) Transcript_23573:105-812(+)
MRSSGAFHLRLSVVQKIVEKGSQRSLGRLAEGRTAAGRLSSTVAAAAASKCVESIVHTMCQRPAHSPRFVAGHVHHCTQYVCLPDFCTHKGCDSDANRNDLYANRVLIVVDEVLVGCDELFLLGRGVGEQAGPGLQVLGGKSAHQRRLVLAQPEKQPQHLLLHFHRQSLQTQVKERGSRCARCKPVFVGELGQERKEVGAQVIVTHAIHHVLYRFRTHGSNGVVLSTNEQFQRRQ